MSVGVQDDMMEIHEMITTCLKRLGYKDEPLTEEIPEDVQAAIDKVRLSHDLPEDCNEAFALVINHYKTKLLGIDVTKLYHFKAVVTRFMMRDESKTNPQKAIKISLKALDMVKDTDLRILILEELADGYGRLEYTDIALDYMFEIIDYMPIDPVWCYEMASYYMVKLDFKEAIQYFEMASTLMGGYEYKSDTVYSPHLFQGKMQIHFGHGYSKCLFSLGRYEEAIIVEHAWSIYFNQEYGGRTSSTCFWATCDYMRGTFREKYLDGEYGTQDDITIELLALCSIEKDSTPAPISLPLSGSWHKANLSLLWLFG